MNKINFENLPSTNTPINAENLNQMQDNIENAIPEVIDNLESDSATDALSAKQGKILNDRFVYSTEEKIIGKWVDGKPVYQKTFIGTWNHDYIFVSNVSDMVKAYGNADVGTGIKRQIPYLEIYNGKNYICRLNLHQNNIKLDSYMDGNQTPATGKIVIEYTKTTD